MKKISIVLSVTLLSWACVVQTTNAQLHYISDFNDGIPDWVAMSPQPFPGSVTEANGTLSIKATFPATPGLPTLGGVAWGVNHAIRDGELLEYRVDLVAASSPEVYTEVMLNCVLTPGEGMYSFAKNANGISVAKLYWNEDWSNPWVTNAAIFFHDQVATRPSGVTLAVTVTRAGDSALLTFKVLDTNNGDAVLYERTVIDTPGIDPTISSTDWPGVTDIGPDISGTPFGFQRINGVWLRQMQITDGNQPEQEIVLDNLTYQVLSPGLGIERAVRLSWPAFNTVFVVEGAPSTSGPWTPVTEPVFQTNGMNWMTVPAPLSRTMEVFRLQKATP